MDNIILIGGGGHAKVLINILQKINAWSLTGYTDRQNRGALLDVPYLGNDDILAGVIHKTPSCKAVVAVGKIDTSPFRLALQDRVEGLGFEFPAVISPSAIVNQDVELGAGTFVGDGVVINSGTSIGCCCIINTSSTVEHDCRLGDNVHIAPGATLSGGVSVGHHSLIGTGSNIIQYISISDRCLIGAGSTVTRNIDNPGTYAGSPCQKIR